MLLDSSPIQLLPWFPRLRRGCREKLPHPQHLRAVCPQLHVEAALLVLHVQAALLVPSPGRDGIPAVWVGRGQGPVDPSPIKWDLNLPDPSSSHPKQQGACPHWDWEPPDLPSCGDRRPQTHPLAQTQIRLSEGGWRVQFLWRQAGQCPCKRGVSVDQALRS